MPYLTIETNAATPVTPVILSEASHLIATVLNKPEGYVIVRIESGKTMIFGGKTSKIGALIEMESIGYPSGKKAELAQALTNLAVKYFNAEPMLVGIHFADMKPDEVSHGGRLMG